MTNKHYTAVVEITSTEEAVIPATGPNRGLVEPSKERKVVEVAKVILRAKTLDKLIEKVTAHVGLVEEEED